MGMAETRYIFWLMWRKDIESPDEIVKCVIDTRKILVIADPPYSLPLRRIVECRAVYVPRYTDYVELVVWGEDQPSRILGPVNPFFPTASDGGNWREVHAMVKVINNLKSGMKIDLDPDPYKRQLKYNKRWVKASDNYDANISPVIYHRVRLEPTVRKMYLALVILLGSLLAVALFLQTLTKFFGFQ
ncbi:MAG: hypothetical protein JNL09_02045 [Anaerolineales bacterium]|nr:hypothetical protein [Anaerolineales bacterium]